MCSFVASAQCNGLKNPTSFTAYNNSLTGQYTGRIGSKPVGASNCNTATIGMNLTRNVSNSALANITSDKVSRYCGSMLGNDRHFRIMSATEGPGTGDSLGRDPLVNYELPYVPTIDNSFVRSIRIGQCRVGAEAEALYYTMQVVPASALVLLHYAIVAQAPGHGVNENPEFVIRVMRQDANNNWTQISDTLCYVVSTTPTEAGGTVTLGQNGWHNYTNIYYKEWAQVAINLDRYLYQTVRIEVITGDCSANGHYAYAYIAGTCQAMNLVANGCAAGDGNQIAYIRAPKGLNGYQWYRSLHGKLEGDEVSDASNYALINGATDSVLDVLIDHMITSNGDTAVQSTFKCVMTSYMDPAKPIYSTLYTDVGNKKPALSIDSVSLCDGTVILTNTSYTPYVTSNDDLVDTSLTVWDFYETPTPTNPPVYTTTGGTATYTYAEGGIHCVRVRTSAYDTTCWNRKPVSIRSLFLVEPLIQPERNNICAGETVTIFDQTPGAIYHRWHIYNDYGLDTLWEETERADIQFRFDKTSTVAVTSHPNMYYQQDTNGDGVKERIYCDVSTDTVIYVKTSPIVHIEGDTVVCSGNQAVLTAVADISGCRFDWYSDTSRTPILTNAASIIVAPTSDTVYWLKVTSPYNCVSYIRQTVLLMQPDIHSITPYYPKHEICVGDTARLWGEHADYYVWSCNPDTDPTFWGQEHNDTIVVSPTETCVYTLTGYADNGCEAASLSQQIVVRPYPIPAISLSPNYIDIDHPTVQFVDQSDYGAASLWNFGNGQTSTNRTVVHTFAHLNQDSIFVTLTSYNVLGCSSDTAFWLPVGAFSVWFPNVFTPQLATNNVFKASTANELVDFWLAVYDRHGLLLFYTTDPEQGWDGTSGGHECPEGSYVYISQYRRTKRDRLQQQKGTVLLLK